MASQYILSDHNDRPINTFDGAQRVGKVYYQVLLDAFGLGPFTYDEAIGALSTKTFGRTQAKTVLNNLVYLKLAQYIGE